MVIGSFTIMVIALKPSFKVMASLIVLDIMLPVLFFIKYSKDKDENFL